jgi:cysteine desulfurase / selenocysteine lyase
VTYRDDFGPFEEAGRLRIWLNAAHQGPLPRVAVAEAREALEWKIAPHRIADDVFLDVPRRLRGLLARLAGGSPDESLATAPRTV